MVRKVNIHEARRHLSRLLEEVASGAEIVIARAGKPIARLVPHSERTEPRAAGLYAGQPFEMAEDFDALPAEMADAFGMSS